MTAVVDTCIVIDVLQHREPFFVDSLGVVQAVIKRDCIGYLTAKSITDIYYIIHKNLHSDTAARDNIRKLYMVFAVVDTLAIDCEYAILSEIVDYEDAVMTETAKRIGADCIVNRNIKDYTKSNVPVYSPKDFLEKLAFEK